MVWTPPNPPPVVLDRRNPKTDFKENIPAVLDWLRAQPAYTNRTITGTLITARDVRITYRVDDEPPFGTPGTWQNYLLTPIGAGGDNASSEPPPTSVVRDGDVNNALTLLDVSWVIQRIIPSVNIPLTEVLIDNAAYGFGSVAVAFYDEVLSAWAFAATAETNGTGLRAAFDSATDVLLAGHTYRFRLGTLGSGVNGTAYNGKLTSIQLSSGLSWTGLALADGTLQSSGGDYSTVPTPQIAAQYVTGDMSGFDRSGVTHKAIAPATVTYDADTRTYTHGIGTIDLAGGTGESAEGALAFTAQQNSAPGAIGEIWRYRANQNLKLTGIEFNGFNMDGLLCHVQTTAGADLKTVTLGATTPYRVNFGSVLELASNTDFQVTFSQGNHVGNLPNVWTSSALPPGSQSAGGAIEYLETAGASGDYGLCCTFYAQIGTPAIEGELPYANLPAALVTELGSLDTRVTALEGKFLDLEAVQNLTTTMIGTIGVFDEATGTYTITLPEPRTDADVQDIVDGLEATGATVTKTHDGSGLVLTIVATGGSTGAASAADLSALAARVTTLEGRPILTAEYVQDVVGGMVPGATYDDAAGTLTLPPDQTLTPEQVQDIVGAFVAAGSNATVTYDDASNTLTISASGGTAPVSSVNGQTGVVVLSAADVGAASTSALTSLTSRVATLEGRPVIDAEFIQDTVAAMIPGATYDDAAGTITLPAGSSIDAEQVRDIIAAFAVAGSNVTVTHNDAGDTLTIAATGGGALTRTTATVTSSVLPNGASENLSITLAKGYTLYKATLSVPGWLRIYRDADSRTADGSRAQTTDPTPGSGVIAEVIGIIGFWDQAVPGWDGKGVPDGVIPLRVTNLSNLAQTLTLTLTYLPTEA